MEDQESEEWKDHEGNPLHPARWLKAQADKDAAAVGEFGRCLGLRCLPWLRCEIASNMKHSFFGGSEHKGGDTKGWGALCLSAMAAGAPKFHGGLAVLKHVLVKLCEYLHAEHGPLFPSLCLPPASGRLTLRQVSILDVFVMFCSCILHVLIVYSECTQHVPYMY